MKTLEISVKFQKDDMVYAIKQEKVEYDCHICEGAGTISYNDKNMKCPECMGAGKFKSGKSVYVVCDEPFRVSSTKINIGANGYIAVKHKGYCGMTALNRSEESLFATKEEAQAKCDELNRERVYVKLNDIIIEDCFKNSPPSIDKIQAKLEYYKNNKKFDSDITIDKLNVLKDGYINYLLCMLLNIDITKVIVEDNKEVS